MKKSNLIGWLSRNSHEKQTPQRFGRYAVMLLMLLTLGVGQMWGYNESYIIGDLLHNYSSSGDNDKWHTEDYPIGTYNEYGTGSTYMYIAEGNYFKIRIYNKQTGQNDNWDMTTNGTSSTFYYWENGEATGAAHYIGNTGIVKFNCTSTESNNPVINLTRPTIYIRHNWGNSGWENKPMTDNNDGTYTLTDSYSGTQRAHVGPEAVSTQNPSASFKDFDADGDNEIHLIGSPTTGDKCLFTFDSYWYRAAGQNANGTSYVGALTIAKIHTITFDLQGVGGVNFTDDVVCTSANDQKVGQPSDPSQDGYIFGGWYTNQACTSSYDFDDIVSSSFTLYAKWTPVTYSVTIAANNTSMGTLTIDDVSQSWGSAYTIGVTNKITVTPNSGYYFTGWSDMPSGMHKATDETTGLGGDAYFYADGTGKTITANFAPRYELHGEQYTGGNGGMPGWDPTTSEFTYAKSEWSFTTDDLTKTTKYKFKLYDRATGSHMGLDTETEFTNGTTPNKSFSTNNEQQGWFTTTFAGPYKFVLDMANKKITITYNSKAIPNYSSKSVTQSLNSAASGYVDGSGTSASHYKVYQTMASEHGKVDLSMNYSGVSTAHDAIYYSVEGVETATMAESESVATATMSMNTSTGSYSSDIKAYAKVDDQYNMSYAAELSGGLHYDVVATPTLSIALKTTSDVVITDAAGLELGTSFKIVPTLSGAIRSGSYITYSYRISGNSDDWTEIANGQATGSAYTWSASLPTEPNIYTIKATYQDLGVTVSATADIVIWKNYTIYVWETGQDLNTENQNITRVHEYYKNCSDDSCDPVRTEHTWTVEGGDPLKTTTDLSSSWGGGWHSFDLKWPLYNYFIVGYEAYNDNQYQSNYYYLATKPEDLYLQCTYHNDSKWTWGVSAIEEPKVPDVTITAINTYSTKLVVDIAIDNHYSRLTTPIITVNGSAPGGSRTGTITEIEGGTYTYTLTGLSDNTDYTFHVVATNGVGTTNKSEVITTLAKMPIKYMIKVSSGLMSDAFWGANSKTTIKVKYENAETGISGTDEVSRKKADEHWWWYEYTFEDSPISFFVCNANNDPASATGGNRSVEISDADANSCTEVIDQTQAETSYHKVREPENGLCGVYYYLKYNNGAKTYISNRINSASDKMSIFIGAYNGGSPAGRSLTLCKYTTGWDETEIFSTVNPTDSAVYVISFVGEDFESSTSVEDWSFAKYTGDYYIRTDHAPGGRTNYRGNTNKMQYSDYAANVTGSTFDHYFCKWVQGESDDKRNVSFTVANEYNDNLLKTPSEDSYYVSDDYATGDGYLKQNASVRFMYDSRKNNLSRAYLSGSSSQSDYFLVLKGNESNHLYTKADKSATHSTNGTADWAFFGDNNNWIYEVDVYAVPGTRVKLTAQMKDKNNANKTQSFLGDDSNVSFDAAYTHLLIGGTGSDAYQMRVIYDFKTNRLMTAWIPTELTGDLAINADVMLIRNGQDAAQQITLNTHNLTDVHTVYAVMQFNRWRLNNRANPELMTVASCAREVSTNNWVYDESVTNASGNHPALEENDENWLTQYQRDLYWISFPFDVNLNEVFGSVGTYGTHWIIEYYDGKGRAQNGFWADSPSNWKFINNVNTTLKAYEGYILALDLDYFAYNNTTTWANNIHQVELYFPSGSSEASPINITTGNVDVEFKNQSEFQCHIDRRTDKSVANTDKDRRVVDSYWHCIGTPSFHNVSHAITTGEDPTNPGADGNIAVPEAGTYWTPEGKLYLYEWNSDNTLSVVTTGEDSPFEFKSMWSYLVQYSGASLSWTSVSKVVAQSVAARVLELPDSEYCLKLMRDSIEEDHTYVRLTDDVNVTTGFEFNYDLCKEKNSGKGNIWTVTTDVIPVAGNSQPHPLTTTIVPVGVKIAANGEYTFSMPEGTNGGDVWLIDNANSSRTNLGLIDYTVNLTTGTYEGRFSLEFPVQNVVTEIENAANANANANADVRKVFVGGRLYILRDGKAYDATGAQVR